MLWRANKMNEHEVVNGLILIISIFGFIILTFLLITYKKKKKDAQSLGDEQ